MGQGRVMAQREGLELQSEAYLGPEIMALQAQDLGPEEVCVKDGSAEGSNREREGESSRRC